MAGNQNRQYSGTTVIKHSNMWPTDLHGACQLTMVNKLIIITIEIFTSVDDSVLLVCEPKYTCLYSCSTYNKIVTIKFRK